VLQLAPGRSRSASDEDDSAHPQTRQRLPVGRSKDWLKFKNPGAPAVKRGGRGGVGTVKSRLVHWLVYTIVAGVLGAQTV
jgi:hypothetical protein